MITFKVKHVSLWLAIFASIFISFCLPQSDRHSKRDHHSKNELKRSKILKKSIAKLLRGGLHLHHHNDEFQNFKFFLSSISVPRSVNSKGHRHVRKFIKSTIRNLSPNWHVEEDSFATESTPLGGKVRFRNIVATYIPSSYLCDQLNLQNLTKTPINQQRIVLSCHYDSLHPSLVHGGGNRRYEGENGGYSRNGRGSEGRNRRAFVGATDAAVSCSILLSLAQYITPFLALGSLKHKHKTQQPPPTIQLIFFDGEEALLKESDTSNQFLSKIRSKSYRQNSLNSKLTSRNSLYGSRHLAREWERTQNVSQAKSNRISSFKPSTYRLASTAIQVCKPYLLKQRSYRSVAIEQNDEKNDGENEIDTSKLTTAELENEIVQKERDEDEDVIDNEVIDSANSVSGHRHQLVVADNNHPSAQGKKVSWSTDHFGNGNSTTSTVGQQQLLLPLIESLAANYHTLANIRLLLLLDLIGGPQSPRFFNTNLQTNRYFRQLAEIEKHLLAAQNVDNEEEHRSKKSKKLKPFFQTNPPFVLSFVRDDHLPFVVRNVPVVHLIPTPFPRNWHTAEDNLAALNWDAIGRVTRVLQIFLLHALKGVI